jgi:nitrous oxidase accessory protein
MRRALWLVAAAGAGLAVAATPGVQAPAEDMALPSAANWGASWEPTPVPAAPARTDVPWFQTLVDAAEPGSVLKPAPGDYSGPVVVNKPLTIDGGGRVRIDNGGKGTVFTLETSGATVRGLRFSGSGSSHTTDDTCLNVRGHDNVIESNAFDDCLFGIDLKQSNRNRVAHNRIRSKPVSLGLRGDAIRLWYSMHNRVEDNDIRDARDMVLWYSNDNVVARNAVTRSRYSLHFMYAQYNLVEGNRYHDNSVGIYVMYTEGVVIRRNHLSRSTGATGMCIGFQEASNVVVEDNDIVYCAIGISSNLSPYQPDSTNTLRGNRIAYNGTGLAFIGNKPGTIIEGNVFEGNLEQVAESGGGSVMNSRWQGNYWDDYQGFDRNRDGVGDTPYELHAFADRIWMETPPARFFKNAPLLEALDFLERLAPFSTPQLLVRDDAPRFVKPEGFVQ